MKAYIDKSFIQNPLLEYFKWIFTKAKIQIKYWGSHIRIGYLATVENVSFEEYNWTAERVFLSNVKMGRFSYVSSGSSIMETEMGRFCSIGPNVKIAAGKHPTHTIVSTHPSIFSNPSYCLRNFADKDYHNPRRKVTIGNDVWICANAVIADGVTIGDGAIVAANSLVNKDVEPFSIVSGVPAKHVRYRFDDQQRLFLLNIKWWDQDLDWIEANSKVLLDIKNFMNSEKL